MSLHPVIAAIEFATPQLLAIIAFNLLLSAGAVWLALSNHRRRLETRSAQDSLKKLRQLTLQLIRRVDNRVLHIQEVMGELAQLEHANNQRQKHFYRALDDSMQSFLQQIEGTADRLRQQASQQPLAPQLVVSTTDSMIEMIQQNYDRMVELGKEIKLLAPADDDRPAAALEDLEQTLRAMQQRVAEANQEFAASNLRINSNENHPTNDGPDPKLPAAGITDRERSFSKREAPAETVAASPDLKIENRSTLAPDSPATLMEVVAEGIANQESSFEDERRSEKRWTITMPVVAIPLDAEYKPIGNPCSMITHDLSLGGISLLHSMPVDAEFLRVELNAPGLEAKQLVVRVLRSRSIGDYRITVGEFVARMDGQQPPA